MPRSNERLTKKGVLSEIRHLRTAIRSYTSMTDAELQKELMNVFPHVTNPQEQSRDDMIRTLLMVATYHTANVLNLE